LKPYSHKMRVTSPEGWDIYKSPLSKNENNPQYNIVYGDQIFSSNDEKINREEQLRLLELFSKYEEILRSKKTRTIYKYLLQVGCATVKDIVYDTGVPYGTAARTLPTLIRKNLVVKVYVLQRRGVSGCRPVIYGVQGYSKQELDQAVSRALRRFTPIYRHVDALLQRTLPEIQDEEIQFRKIMHLARKHSGKGFNYIDLANEVARELSRNGVRVWR